MHADRPRFSVHQIGAILGGLFSASVFFALCAPFLPSNGVREAFIGFYVFLLATTIFMFFYITHRPSHFEAKRSVKSAIQIGRQKYCLECKIITPLNAKHCHFCGHCIDTFDHHCIWLNMCIGIQNYWLFFALVSNTTALLTIQLVGSIVAMIMVASSPSISAIGPFTSSGGYIGTLATLSLVPLVALFALAALLVFHIYLLCKGLTTYSYMLGVQLPSFEPTPTELAPSSKTANVSTFSSVVMPSTSSASFASSTSFTSSASSASFASSASSASSASPSFQSVDSADGTLRSSLLMPATSYQQWKASHAIQARALTREEDARRQSLFAEPQSLLLAAAAIEPEPEPDIQEVVSEAHSEGYDSIAAHADDAHECDRK